MKLLLWLVILLVVVMWLLHGKKAAVKRNKSAAAGRHAANPKELVQCAHCGIHLPASEAVLSASGTVFCSQEHRLEHVGS